MAKIYDFKTQIDEAIDHLLQGDNYYKGLENGQPTWVNRYNDILFLRKAIYKAYNWNHYNFGEESDIF